MNLRTGPPSLAPGREPLTLVLGNSQRHPCTRPYFFLIPIVDGKRLSKTKRTKL